MLSVKKQQEGLVGSCSHKIRQQVVFGPIFCCRKMAIFNSRFHFTTKNFFVT